MARRQKISLLGTYVDGISKGVKKTAKVVDKQFSSMIGPIAGAAAGYFAFTAVVNQARAMEQLALRAQDTSRTFTNLTTSIGLSAEVLLTDMRKAARGTISDLNLMEKANTANLLAGKELVSELPGLIEGARAASAATGQTVDFMFESIVTGIARQSRMILDNLGIIVNVDKANKEYAKTLGIQANALDEAQRKQAFMNAVIKASADMVERSGGAMELARDKANRLDAQIENLQINVGEKLIPIMNDLREAMFFWLGVADKFFDKSGNIEKINSRVALQTLKLNALQARYNEELDRLKERGKTSSFLMTKYAESIGKAKGKLAEAKEAQEAFNASLPGAGDQPDEEALAKQRKMQEELIATENQNAFLEELNNQFRTGQLTDQELFNQMFLEGDISTAEKRIELAKKLAELRLKIQEKENQTKLKREQVGASKLINLTSKIFQAQTTLQTAAFNNEQALGRKAAVEAVKIAQEQANGVIDKHQGIALAKAWALGFPLNIPAIAAVATGFAAIKALVGAGAGAVARSISPPNIQESAGDLQGFDVPDFGGGGGFDFGSTATDTAEAETRAPTQIELHIQTLDPAGINWEEVVDDNIAPALRKLGELGVAVEVTAG